MHDMKEYLESTTFIDFNDESVRDRADALARGLETDREKAVAKGVLYSSFPAPLASKLRM